MTIADPTELLELATTAARAAGEVHRHHLGDRLDAITKSSPTDPATIVDTESEAVLLDVLLGARPDDAVLGEEGGSRDGTSGVRWILDPLDGTVNYLYGLRASSVSVAAELHGTVVAGAVLDPAHDECFTASLGGGAHLDGRRLAPARPDQLAACLVGTGFSYDAGLRAEQADVLTRVLPAVRDIRRIGSAALDLCWTAAGRLDVYYERWLNEWDRAAGALIAREAGLVVVGAAGDEPDDLTLVAPPHLVDDLHALVTGP
ncbi:MAG: inositol monophosphatase family protein [Actinomycetota bacterium]